MSEWWTYRLSDFLLFSAKTYYRLFELYNRDVWPLQLLTLALGAGMLALLLRGPVWRGRVVAAILAAVWLWVAWAYQLQRYAAINWAAPYFAAAFMLQAALLMWTGAIRDRLRLRRVHEAPTAVAVGIFGFALLAYPLIAPLLGRTWAQTEVFGIAPDPTAVATLGVLLLAHRVHWLLLLIPLLWCAITGAVLWTLHAPEALVAPVAALLAIVFPFCKTARPPPGSPQQ